MQKKGDSLERFLDAQERDYEDALNEISRGQKRSHWMWYIFPQLAGLGRSDTSRYYAIRDIDEAVHFLQQPLLKQRLVGICRSLLKHKNLSAREIFGSPDDLKLRSSMTLFASVPGADPVFQEVLDRFYDGEKDLVTLQLLKSK